MEWSETRIGMLRKLWVDGLSASQIAERLGGTTRNAVIGKAHRLGLKSRPSPIKRETDNITTLNDRMCHWPIGHPREPDFHFCGKAIEPGRPYCSSHTALAYRRTDESAA
jgi:GcrA cell cycle regulator